MGIDYSIEELIKRQAELYKNRINSVQVDLSSDNKRRAKIVGDVLYIKVTRGEYDRACSVAQQINKAFREEDILKPSNEMEAARKREEAIKYFSPSSRETKARRERQRRIKYYKKELDDNKRKKREKIQKREKRKQTIKGFVGIAVLVPGMILGTMAASKSIQAKEIDNSNTIVEFDEKNFETNEQIRDKIDDVIKSEISKATGSEKEDISFRSEWIDSKTQKTVLNIGDEEYKYIKELGGISTGNLKSKGIVDLISTVKEAKTTDELISALDKANKFSKEKDLKVKGKKIVEIDSEER